VTNLLEEGRMVLPGIQALIGFQLIAVFNDGFQQLSPALQLTHLAATLLVALAVLLIMTPAAYHRIAEQGQVSRRFTELASMFIAVAMLPFALGMSLEISIVTNMVTDSTFAAAAAFIFAIVLSTSAWFVFPLLALRVRRAREHGE
jgi:hypothetical protein